MRGLDVEGSAVNLISINFAKAFNSMSHQACLSSLLKHDASIHIVRIVSAFLLKRRMQFWAGSAVSSRKRLNGGSPQGTLLGNFMFVMTTDLLEVNSNDKSSTPTKSFPIDDGLLHSPPPSNVQHDEASDIMSTSMNSAPSGDDSFVYFRQCRCPYNRLEDTNISLTFESQTDRPTDYGVSAPVEILKYVDDFLGSGTVIRSSLNQN